MIKTLHMIITGVAKCDVHCRKCASRRLYPEKYLTTSINDFLLFKRERETFIGGEKKIAKVFSYRPLINATTEYDSSEPYTPEALHLPTTM